MTGEPYSCSFLCPGIHQGTLGECSCSFLDCPGIHQGTLWEYSCSFLLSWHPSGYIGGVLLQAVIVPLCSNSRTIELRATSQVLALSTSLIASSPQQRLACFHMLPVDLASILSRKHRTPFLHPFAAHLNS